MTRLRALFITVVLTLLFAPTSQAGASGAAYFQPFDGGDNVLSEVYIDPYQARDGEFVAELTIYPARYEIDALLEEGNEDGDTPDDGSHVDFAFTFIGLETTGDGYGYSVERSDHIRYIGHRGSSEFEDPTVEVLGFNLERWDDADSLTITVTLYGYESYRATPVVEVELTSSTWWPEVNGCTVDYERDSDDDGEADEFFCSKQHRTTSLIDGDTGDDRFPIQ